MSGLSLGLKKNVYITDNAAPASIDIIKMKNYKRKRKSKGHTNIPFPVLMWFQFGQFSNWYFLFSAKTFLDDFSNRSAKI